MSIQAIQERLSQLATETASLNAELMALATTTSLEELLPPRKVVLELLVTPTKHRGTSAYGTIELTNINDPTALALWQQFDGPEADDDEDNYDPNNPYADLQKSLCSDGMEAIYPVGLLEALVQMRAFDNRPAKTMKKGL
jgi:hypothetical protein